MANWVSERVAVLFREVASPIISVCDDALMMMLGGIPVPAYALSGIYPDRYRHQPTEVWAD